MPVLVAIHRLNDFDAWFEVFSANPPPKIGRWRLARGIEDPNRVHLVAELEPSEVDEVKRFIASDEMQSVFSKVNEMSTAPLEFIWLDEVTPQ